MPVLQLGPDDVFPYDHVPPTSERGPTFVCGDERSAAAGRALRLPDVGHLVSMEQPQAVIDGCLTLAGKLP
jgi:hypothetical protein